MLCGVSLVYDVNMNKRCDEGSQSKKTNKLHCQEEYNTPYNTINPYKHKTQPEEYVASNKR